MKIKVLAASAALLALAVSQAASAGPDTQLSMAPPEAAGFSAERLHALDAAMDAAVDNGEVAGIETMLVRHGKIVDLHFHGVKNTAGDPVARDTIFRMYSQTKPMVGVAMMILYEQGLWKLDDPVTKFVPEFAHLKVLGPEGHDGKPVLEDMTRPPTMRELMTHTAGFGYGLRTGNPVDDAFRDQKVLASDGLKAMIDKIATIPLLYQPGTKWSYSAAVDIQGYIIEKLTGQRLGDYMAEHIFKPLGMVDTGFFVPPANGARLSGIYVQNPATGKLVELTPALFPMLQDFTKQPPMDSGGGGSVSTVDDYGRFCQMILNGGVYNGARILKSETVALMQQNHLAEGVTADANSAGGVVIGGKGLGFGLDFAVVTDPKAIGTPQGAGSIWWGGAAGTWFWIDPKNDLFFLGMIQRFGGGAAGSKQLGIAAQGFIYPALTHPEH
jgi:CubicO group peptidase (beta-lactamase class C family)